MSVDPKKAAKLSDLTRLMSDEGAAVPEQKTTPALPGWGSVSIDSILDDLVAAVNLPMGYLYGSTPDEIAESRWLTRQLTRHVAPRGTREDVLRAAHSVRGVERVEIDTAPGLVNVYITQVSSSEDHLQGYRERLELPVLTAVRAVAAAGVAVRVYVRTPLIAFIDATELAANECRSRYTGQRITPDVMDMIHYDFRQLTERYLRDRIYDRTYRLSSEMIDVLSTVMRGLSTDMRRSESGAWCVDVRLSYAGRTYSRRVEFMW